MATGSDVAVTDSRAAFVARTDANIREPCGIKIRRIATFVSRPTDVKGYTSAEPLLVPIPTSYLKRTRTFSFSIRF